MDGHETWRDTQTRILRDSFQQDPDMEHLLTIKEQHPGRYERLPAVSRIALGTYLASKRAAKTGNPTPTSKTFPNRNDSTQEADR